MTPHILAYPGPLIIKSSEDVDYLLPLAQILYIQVCGDHVLFVFCGIRTIYLVRWKNGAWKTPEVNMFNISLRFHIVL